MSLVTWVRGRAVEPMIAASGPDGVFGAMNAAFGLRATFFAAFLGAAFFATAFLAAAFFGAAFFAAFLAGAFFAAFFAFLVAIKFSFQGSRTTATAFSTGATARALSLRDAEAKAISL